MPAAHAVGAEADEDRQDQDEAPAFLCEQGENDEGYDHAQQGAEHTQGGLVRRLADRVQADKGHGESRPIGLFSIQREGGLQGLSEAHRQGHGLLPFNDHDACPAR